MILSTAAKGMNPMNGLQFQSTLEDYFMVNDYNQRVSVPSKDEKSPLVEWMNEYDHCTTTHMSQIFNMQMPIKILERQSDSFLRILYPLRMEKWTFSPLQWIFNSSNLFVYRHLHNSPRSFTTRLIWAKKPWLPCTLITIAISITWLRLSTTKSTFLKNNNTIIQPHYKRYNLNSVFPCSTQNREGGVFIGSNWLVVLMVHN